MDANDFQYVESRLQVVIPTVFKGFFSKYPNDRTRQVQFDCAILPVNAELFVIKQLRRFNNSRAMDYYELTPELRDHRFLDIGDDGCGNFHCMVGNAADSNELWMWEHDPYNGMTRCEHQSLTDYFSTPWQLTTCDDPFVLIPSSGRVVSRADHPARGLLEPIAMEEWQSYVANDPALDMDEYQTATNPFTKETVKMRRWPGRAKLSLEDDSETHITYSDGCLALTSKQSLSPSLSAKMESIAQRFRANLF